MKHYLLPIVAAFFGAHYLPAARQCGAVTLPSPPAPGPQTIEQQLEAARADLGAARTTLAERDQTIGTLTSERDTARTDLQSRTQERDTAIQERDTARGELQTRTQERDQARTDLQSRTQERDTAHGNVTRLETLCAVKGVDPRAAVPAAPADPAQLQSASEFESRLANAKTPAEQTTILNEFAAAARDGKIKPLV